MANEIPASFRPGSAKEGPAGAIAHEAALEHVERLRFELYEVGDSAWSLVGNGLSNQTFVEGPEGIIAIDTGESVEEMDAALAELRKVTDRPVVACIYTHFHYVNGTMALDPADDFPIYGHSGIDENLSRLAGEVAPRSSRGMVHQFGTALPAEGPDALVSCGLGFFLRNPAHAPFTPGYVPANHTFDAPTRTRIAGLDVELVPAPSDATDSITIWFPALGLCVNNLVWPALFNVFAIRSEEYRDPRILLAGLDHIASLGPEYLAGAHGPPLYGADEIREEVERYRDSIQFLWDQTVRAANQGLSLDEIIERVQLPDCYSESYLTTQLYGVAEHHVRQIYTGLFGWFDENEANLFPVPAPRRAARLIDGFGGKDRVRAQVEGALAEDDYRWAVEMASWLVRSESGPDGRTDAGDPEDRALLARCLRGIARNTTSANIRNWCLTRVLELEGVLDLSRFRRHRFRGATPETSLAALRVTLDPNAATGIDDEIAFRFDDGFVAGLRVRRGIAVPTGGENATHRVLVSRDDWGRLLGGKASLGELIDSGAVAIEGSAEAARRLLACFDVESFRR